jgi:beta-glucanase (GH16 family)
MNLLQALKTLVAIMALSFCFQNCKDDGDDKKPAHIPNPPPPLSIAPDPSTDDIPEIAPTSCEFDLDEEDLTSIGWKKVFEDDFDDLSQWNIWTGGAFNNEHQYYQQANLTLEDGILGIAAKKETVTGATHPWDNTQKSFDFTSGRIESKTLYSANSSTVKLRIMARVKLPLGYGLWGAFWTYGDPWPVQGEIDIIESRGQDPLKYQTNYFYGTAANTNLVTGAEHVITADEDLTDCYHVYELIWQKDKLIYLLDGAVVELKTSGGHIPSMFDTEQKIVFNLAVGGNFFSSFDPEQVEPNTMYIDWVKVFTAK